MKGLLLLLLFCLTISGAAAQSSQVPTLDANALELARRVFLPIFGLFLICNFVLGAIKLVLNYLLRRQIVVAGVSESVIERLLPSEQDEQNKVVKWVALLLSSGVGLALCSWYLPLGLHSITILLFSTAFGFLAYYLFLRRQTK